MLNRLKNSVDTNPNRVAYKIDDKEITYKELWNKAKEYSILLKKQGTSPVIVYNPKSINVIISILACIMAGRTYIPIASSTPLNRIKEIINQTKSSLILTTNHLEIDNVDCMTLKELKKYKEYEEKTINNKYIYMIFTSGTTGKPKGVPISKTNLNNFINWISNIKPLKSYKNINVLNQANFSFDLSVADLYYALCNGHTLISIDNDIQNEYEEIYKVMKEVDLAVITPTFMKLLLINNDFNYKNYSKLKCIYFCGEQLEIKTTKKIFEAFPNIEIINAYGPTEATSAVSEISITKEMLDNKTLLPVGEIDTCATSIEIIDDEIVLKGNSVFDGYIGNEVGGYFKEGNINCYKTGDIGYIKDGKIYCKGRKDNQIKYKGYRIELNEIEYHLNKIKGIKDCAVVAIYNDNNIVKTIKAFVVLDMNIDITKIKEELKENLPSYMLPKSIIELTELPTNQNGKVDRKALINYEK